MHSKFKLFISAILCFTIALAASCSGEDNVKSAVTAFADTESTVTVPTNSLEVVEALQNVFRSVSSNVLKSVVEVDVIETKTRPANPFEDLPFFFLQESYLFLVFLQNLRANHSLEFRSLVHL